MESDTEYTGSNRGVENNGKSEKILYNSER